MTANAKPTEGRRGDAPRSRVEPTEQPDASGAPVARVLSQAASIERRELDRALARLDDRGELTDERRAVLADLADALVTELVATPLERAVTVEASCEGEPHDPALRRAVSLFVRRDHTSGEG
ncbi:hypothetical protein ACFQPA_18595 [Halomarina halobia]|uniref:Tetrapyrrole biosynthesis glutamyl-tRNA reductase dimerisation domain-containing protein n=1 Tax=Halomarina halobia TaxID=3033386 RepID=A0ABD6AD62_9EURY|nr:hypothetical protein [Halomarina sp. PSR21]